MWVTPPLPAAHGVTWPHSGQRSGLARMSYPHRSQRISARRPTDRQTRRALRTRHSAQSKPPTTAISGKIAQG